jgi:hypothetical protein
MGLEDLSAEDRARINLGKLVHEMMNDPNLAEQTKRLLKQKKPELNFPELDQAEALRKVQEESEKRVQALKDEIRTNQAKAALQAEESKIEEAGLEVKAVREFMEKRGITDIDVVIELFQSRAALAEPSTPQFQPLKVPNLKEMWENPVAWREKEGYAIQQELRGRKPIRQTG